MIDPLDKFVRPSNSFKIIPIYFGKVRRKSNVCIIKFYWLIALYIFTLLPCNASFLIVKNSFSGKKSLMSTNHCERTYFWWVHAFSPQLFFKLPNWHFSLHLPPLRRPRYMRSRQFRTLDICQSPDKFTGKRKTQIDIYVYIYIVHRIRGQWHRSISLKVFTCHQ